MKKVLFITIALFAFISIGKAQSGLLTEENRQMIQNLKNYSMRVSEVLITYEDDSVAQDIVILPDSAIIWDIDVRQITNFDDGGVDSLEIGLSDDQDYFVDMIVNTGAAAWDSVVFSAEPPYLLPSADTVRAMYWGGDSDATAGQVAVYVKYTIR